MDRKQELRRLLSRVPADSRIKYGDHGRRPKVFMTHPTMNSEELRIRTQGVWDRFYGLGAIWKRSNCVQSLRARLAFIFISKLYRQMYASTGLAADSARRNRANKWARWLAVPCRKLFHGAPMPGLQVPPRCVEVIADSSAKSS